MFKISKESKSPLLPERHPTPDLFVCDVFDAVPKGDMASMEHPIFSLSTKPDTRIRRYGHKEHFIEIIPSVKGLATMHDRDILIYCISQLISGLNNGREPSQTIRFKAYDLLKATNRMTNGQGYEGLKAALERLRGTSISTNIVTGGEEQFDTFGIIDRARIIRETRDGRMQEVEIKLADWVFNAIRAKEVLTLHRDYFRLRKPLERRIYELARKHCGSQNNWKISLALLQKKCGSNSTTREFKRLVQNIVRQDGKHSHMPDYSIKLDDGGNVCFANRGTMRPKNEPKQIGFFFISPETRLAAKDIAKGWDIDHVEQEWRCWVADQNKGAPKNPNKAFLGFCKTWFQTRGQP